MGRRSFQSFLAATRRLYQLQLGRTSITPSISQLATFGTTYAVPTGTQSPWSPFLPSPKVSPLVPRRACYDLFLTSMSKATRQHANNLEFRKFRRQLFHTSLARILRSLRPGMETPEIIRCGDGHYRKIFYGLGPYIADYPEQALVCCIVQGWCPTYVCIYHSS